MYLIHRWFYKPQVLCSNCKNTVEPHSISKAYCCACSWCKMTIFRPLKANLIGAVLNKGKIELEDLRYIIYKRDMLIKLALCRVFINQYNIYCNEGSEFETIKEHVDIVNSKIMDYYKLWFTLNLFNTKVHEFIL